MKHNSLPPILLVLSFATQALSSSEFQYRAGGYKLMCYTCMSDNVPQISKDIMRQTINIPEHTESRVCNDPFLNPDTAIQEGIKMEPCETACIKVFSENKYLRVTLRGCLDQLYTPGYLGFPLPDSAGTYRDTCDRQRQSSSGIGETVTDTCICTRNYCNGAEGRRRIGLTTLLLLPLLTFLFGWV